MTNPMTFMEPTPGPTEVGGFTRDTLPKARALFEEIRNRPVPAPMALRIPPEILTVLMKTLD